MRVHVCVLVIKGLPYEDTLCESRNTQQDLSPLSEAHTQTHKLRDYRKQKRAEEEINMTLSLRHKEEYRQKNTETNRESVDIESRSEIHLQYNSHIAQSHNLLHKCINTISVSLKMIKDLTLKILEST